MKTYIRLAAAVAVAFASAAAGAAQNADTPPQAPPLPTKAPTPAEQLLSNVTIYGTLLPFTDEVEVRGATAVVPTDRATQVPASRFTGVNPESRARITSGTSNIGFKGYYEVAQGVRAWYQIESAVGVDGDNPNVWAGRNSGIGVTSELGTVMVGRWDTPYKVLTLDLGPVRGLNPFDNPMTGVPGFAIPATTTQNDRVGSAADASFNRRQGNSVQYWSPTWKGLSGRLSYSVAEGTTNESATAPGIEPTIVSGYVRWDKGPLSLRYGYERHNDYFGMSWLGGSAMSLTNASAHDIGQEISAVVKLGNTRIGALIERLDYNNDDQAIGAVKSYQRDAAHVTVQQQFGKQKVWAAFGVGDNGKCELTGGGPCSTNDLGVKTWSAGYMFSFTPKTDFYYAMYGIDNEAQGSYSVFPGVGNVPLAPGSQTRGFGAGMLFMF